MALLLPQCTSSLESLHQLASLRQRVFVRQHHRSRRSVRASNGGTGTQVISSDQIKIPSSEPCCTISSIVMAPRKPPRRSTRLRAKKGREGAKAGPAEDMEVAEWASRVLANNGVVEIDPVTMAEVNGGNTDINTHNRIASLTTSSEVPDYFPPRDSGFPRFPGVPFEVLVAAGSAVALATVAAILNTLSNQRAGARPSQTDNSEGNYLGSDFAGEPVKGTNSPQLTRDKKLPAEVLASTAGVSAGAAILTAFDLQPGSVRTGLDKSSMPLPPSLSKNGPPREQQRKWDSVTPFFPPHRSSESYPKSAPNARWSEEKYKSVAPFFPSDRNGASLESVTPFFADEQQGSESQNGTSVESATPFFADDRGRELKNGLSLEGVPPFFADERDSGVSLENVAPFFPDEQGRSSSQTLKYQNVTPFFPDEQGRSSSQTLKYQNVTPFFPDEQGRSSSQTSKYQNVTPFFQDDRVGSSGQLSGSDFREQSVIWDGESKEATRDSLAGAMSPDSAPTLPRLVNLKGRTPFYSTQLNDQRSVGNERAFSAVPEDLLSGPMQSEGKQLLAKMANRSQDQHREFLEGSTADRLGSSFRGGEAPSLARDLTPEELAIIKEIEEEEARQEAKFRALQAAFPALAIGAGAVGALVGVDGAFQMVGITATASFISYELLWATKRRELLDEISRITDHHKLFYFLQKRKIVKDDC